MPYNEFDNDDDDDDDDDDRDNDADDPTDGGGDRHVKEIHDLGKQTVKSLCSC